MVFRAPKAILDVQRVRVVDNLVWEEGLSGLGREAAHGSFWTAVGKLVIWFAFPVNMAAKVTWGMERCQPMLHGLDSGR